MWEIGLGDTTSMPGGPNGLVHFKFLTIWEHPWTPYSDPFASTLSQSTNFPQSGQCPL